MLTKEGKEVVLKYCLQNAIFYSGKANPGAVIGKVLGEREELRKKVKDVRTEIEKIVKSVNKLSPDEQKKRLEEMAPKLLKKPEKKEGLPDLKGAKMGKVVTRFAPAPTGPIHIAHLMRAVFLSYIYAKKYKGKFYIRFEDTDPKKVEAEFYDWILEDLEANFQRVNQASILAFGKELDKRDYYFMMRLTTTADIPLLFIGKEKGRGFLYVTEIKIMEHIRRLLCLISLFSK